MRQFADAADKLLGAVAEKRAALLGDRLARVEMQLPEALGKQVDETLDTWRQEGCAPPLGAGRRALDRRGRGEVAGWLQAPEAGLAMLDRLRAFQDEVHQEGFKTVLLLGMGGSSLGPEVLGETFGHRQGYPELLVLDTTDPDQVAQPASGSTRRRRSSSSPASRAARSSPTSCSPISGRRCRTP